LGDVCVLRKTSIVIRVFKVGMVRRNGAWERE
jgi:hypothetical protein